MDESISDPGEATREWLETVLKINGLLRNGRVASVKVKSARPVAFSMVSRLEIFYSGDENGESGSEAHVAAPRSLFLKTSKPDSKKESFAGAGKREVAFYRSVASQMQNPPAVRCYDAAYSPETGQSHLLLDDLSATHFQTVFPLPPPKIHCELAVQSLAKFHASWWENPRLGGELGELFNDQSFQSYVEEIKKALDEFIEFLGDRISSRRRGIFERLQASSFTPWKRLTSAEGLTLVHGDAHWWNFFYPRDPERARAVIFDWGTWNADLGARDLAHMIALHWYPERRAAMERELLKIYHDTLLSSGVKNYGWDGLWTDYRCAAIRNLVIPVLQRQRGMTPAVWWSNLERAMLAFDDLGCAELI